MHAGKLIVIEGACDGIGKSTQYKLLNEWLINEGIEIVSHHFPSYGTPQALPVEKFLKGEFGQPKELSAYFINSLYALDRAITWNEKLKSAYAEGKIITLDRYTTSSIIYQSALLDNFDDKKKFADYVMDYEYNKMNIKRPDLVIFLNAPFDIVTELRNSRKSNDGIEKDVFERDTELQRNIYESAIYMAYLLNFDIINCFEDSKMRSIENIHDNIKRLVKKKCL